MDIKTKLAYTAIDFVAPLVLGYLARRKNCLSEKICDGIILINLLFIFTVLSVLSLWVLPLRIELIWLSVLGLILCVIPGIMSYVFYRNKYDSPLDKGSYMISSILSNTGTLCGLGAFILFGETGFAYSQIIVSFQVFVMFLFCFPMARYYRDKGFHGKNIVKGFNLIGFIFNRNQLPIIGLLIGITLYISGIERPALLGELVNPLVHISAWAALVPVGFSIDFSEIKQYYRSVLDLVPVKFIVTPLLGYFIAFQLFSDKLILNTVLLLACAPTAINAVVIARLYNLNVHIAGAAFVLTTTVFLFIVFPLLCIWFAFG